MRTFRALALGLALVSSSIASSACMVDGSSDEATALCDEAELSYEICSALYASASGDEKADDNPQLRGIIVKRVGNRTYFKIPLAHTAGGEQRALLDETVKKFTTEMQSFNATMRDRGIDLSGVLDVASSAEFQAHYTSTLESIFSTSLEEEMELRLGETVADPTSLWDWRRYLVPQAFIGYFGTKFSVNAGVGAGISATVLVVVQPWLSLEIEHTADQPRIVGKDYEVDVSLLGVPNLDVGIGVGGGMPLRIGIGAVFGPMDQPEDLTGLGLGISGSFAIPVAGGGNAKVVTVLKNPPLFLAMLGYSSGTAANLEIHGNLQYIMDLDSFLEWIRVSTGNAFG